MQHVTDCHVDPVERRVTESERREARALHLSVAGMGCVNCANRVRNALMQVGDVVDVEVDVIAGLATVWHRAGRVRTEALVDAVADAGRMSHHRYLAVLIASPD